MPIVPMRLQPMPEFEPFAQPVMAHDKVRYVGEALAVVLAESARSPRTRWTRSRSTSSRCRRCADGTSAAKDKTLLFERSRHQSSR